jgi:hypothetical protein
MSGQQKIASNTPRARFRKRILEDACVPREPRLQNGNRFLERLRRQRTRTDQFVSDQSAELPIKQPTRSDAQVAEAKRNTKRNTKQNATAASS